MTSNGKVGISLVFILIVQGCSSDLVIKKLPEFNGKTGDSEQIDGIPFRVMSRFKVSVYKKGKKGYEKLEPVTPLYVNTPDPYHLYVLGFDGKPLSDSTFKATISPATHILKSVSISSSERIGAALSNTGTEVSKVSELIAKIEKAKLEQEKADIKEREATETKREAALKKKEDAIKEAINDSNERFDLVLAADKANQAAKLAEAKFGALQKDSSSDVIELLIAEQQVRAARLEANRAARLAGKLPYYPDAIP